MNEREHDELRINLGAYALGQLPADEVATLEAHLDGCAECTAELAELTPAAAALGDLKAHPASGEQIAPPADLGPRVVAAVTSSARAEQRRSWGRTAAVAAAAAAAVLVGTLTVQSLTRDPAPVVPLEAVPVTVEGRGLRASADLVNHTWGVEVKLHGTGFDTGERYRVTVLGDNGRRYRAGEFVGVGAVEMNCNLNSSVLRAQAAGFEVRDAENHVVLSSRFG